MIVRNMDVQMPARTGCAKCAGLRLPHYKRGLLAMTFETAPVSAMAPGYLKPHAGQKVMDRSLEI
jgi:hypothetical protein